MAECKLLQGGGIVIRYILDMSDLSGEHTITHIKIQSDQTDCTLKDLINEDCNITINSNKQNIIEIKIPMEELE
jgi:hypothetical protein